VGQRLLREDASATVPRVQDAMQRYAQRAMQQDEASMERKELTPTKSIVLLTGATDHVTMTADETHSKCSTPATKVASPRLALTGEVALRLPSVFIRTVGVPVESRTPGSFSALSNGQGDLSWEGNRHRLSPSRFVSTPTRDGVRHIGWPCIGRPIPSPLGHRQQS
jgi:hypothetical protein